jgi:hypothetical protein
VAGGAQPGGRGGEAEGLAAHFVGRNQEYPHTSIINAMPL